MIPTNDIACPRRHWHPPRFFVFGLSAADSPLPEASPSYILCPIHTSRCILSCVSLPARMSLPVTESPTSARPPKVLIPRLERRPDDNASRNPPRSSQRPRVPRTSKACLSCRQRKVKCNGGQPQCTNCIGNDKPCVYPQARRDRLRTSDTPPPLKGGHRR